MFLHLAYTAGTRRAVQSLGLYKFAGVLPPPTVMATNIGKALGRGAKGNLQARGDSVLRNLPSRVLTSAPKAEQYLAVAGKGSPTESHTSRVFRDTIKEQVPLSPGAQAVAGNLDAALAALRKQPVVSGVAKTHLAAPLSTGQTVLPAATVRPPRKL